MRSIEKLWLTGFIVHSCRNMGNMGNNLDLFGDGDKRAGFEAQACGLNLRRNV
jgi:hypothetical protein